MRAEQYKQCLLSLRHFYFLWGKSIFLSLWILGRIKNPQNIFQRLLAGAESFLRQFANAPGAHRTHLHMQSVCSAEKARPNLSATAPQPFHNKHTTLAPSETNARLASKCNFGRTLSFPRVSWKQESPKPCHHRKYEKSRFANAGMFCRFG